MSDADPVRLDFDGPIARIRFNRPHVLNAINEPAILAFKNAVERIAASDGVRVVILSGEGKGFLAGGDVGRFHEAGEQAAEVVASIIGPFHSALRTLTSLDQPVIAALHGAVAGAGLSMALAADLAIAAEDAKFTLAYTRIGTSPDGGASWALPRVVGLRKAMELALLSDVIGADEALRIGLVNEVVPAPALAGRVDELAGRLAQGPTHAFGQVKALLRGSFERNLPAQLQAEQEGFLSCVATEDFKEGTAAFVEKRAARFAGK
ncbi:MAG: enoyl-CoA hydratase-related protein [Pseudomonadota bacterium]